VWLNRTHAEICGSFREPADSGPSSGKIFEITSEELPAPEPSFMLQITPSIVIEDSEIEERFVRASGPGGQNVNKVSTAVQLRFDAGRSRSIDEDVRERLRALAGSRMTIDGMLVIDARTFRTQAQNREAARERLVELLRKAAVKPKRRRRTRPSGASKLKRLDAKKRRAGTKQGRRSAKDDD
jgi:ribosome-associated protein